MKLHYSQTTQRLYRIKKSVSVPYEITLLSNNISECILTSLVSVPYEITLLSNSYTIDIIIVMVSVPYEITLLSNSNL